MVPEEAWTLMTWFKGVQKKAERIIIPKIVLCGKRQFVYIGNIVYFIGIYSRIINLFPKAINEDRMTVGRRFVEDTGIYLVLKGARSILFNPDGEIYINPTGNPALAKGGSGDILTGFIGGFLSQGYTPTEASLLGMYLHGYLADSWVETNTDMDLLAGDLLSGLGDAIRAIKDGKERIYIEKSL